MREAPSPNRISIALLVAVGLLAGCHAVFPYEASRSDAAASDHSVFDGSRDGPGADGAADGPVGEARDLAAPGDGAADLPAGDVGCVVPPTLMFGGPCTSQCGVPTGDQECDGLPDERDPWPGSCNQGLLADELANPAAWQLVDGGAAWSCGAATLDDGTAVRLVGPAFGGSPAYLTEVHLTVDQIANPTSWMIGVRSAVDGQQLRACQLYYSASRTSAPVPSVDAVSPQGTQLGGILDNTQTIAGFAVGEPLLLQLWSDPPGTHHCRAMTLRDGALRSVSSDVFVLVPAPDLDGTPCGSGFCITATDLCAPCPAGGGMCCTLNVPLATAGTIELFTQGVRGTFISVTVWANP